MAEDPNQVLIERGSGKKAEAGSVIFRARHNGAPISLKVFAAVLDGFHSPRGVHVGADEWTEAAYANIEDAATRKAGAQGDDWDTLEIEVRDIR